MKEEMTAYLRTVEKRLLDQGKKSLETMLLESGKWFEGRASSDEYAEATKWRRTNDPKVNECFFNAQKFCMDTLEAGMEDIQYFEGYILVRSGLDPAQHGWVVLHDGRVLDLTAEAMEHEMAKRWIQTKTTGALYLGLPIPIDLVILANNDATSCGSLADGFYLGKE